LPDDVLPFDPSLQANPTAPLLWNRGCPPGYFAQFVGAEFFDASVIPVRVVVAIPDTATSNNYVRCRLMATTDAGTIQAESGTTWQETLEAWRAAVGQTGSGLLAGLGGALPWLALGAFALLALGRRR